jgi:hypothetical protein
MSGSSGTDLNQLLLQAQQSATQGVSPKLNIFTPFLSDADCFSGLSSKGKGLNCDAKMMRIGSGKGPGKFAKAFAEAFDAVSKINKENMPQGIPLQQASVGDIAGHGLGGTGQSMSGGHEI